MKRRQVRKSVGDTGYNKSNNNILPAAFTLIEVMMVVIILAIAAMIAVPFAVSGAGTQLKAAANIVASDLEYAKSMAITTGKEYSVVFDTSAESYRIEDVNGVVINHPIKRGFQYVVNFSTDKRLNKVDITSVNFSGSTVEFDYLGSPDNLSEGTVTLSAGGGVMYVNVEPVTGYITITD